MKKLIILLSSLILLALLVVGAIPIGGDLSGLSKSTGVPRSTLMNINNISVWIRADGWSARNPQNGNSGLTFPRGTSQAIYQDGLVFGGLVSDGQTPILRVGGQTYNIGTIEGRIISKGVAEIPNYLDPNTTVRIFRIRKDYVTADLHQDAAEINSIATANVTEAQVAEVRDQYAQDWAKWPWQKGAPFYDTGYLNALSVLVGANNGILDWGEDADKDGVLDAGEDANGNGVLDGETPGFGAGDQVIWTVMNDLNSGLTAGLYGSPPVGMEIQVTQWGYFKSGPLGNMYFKQFQFIYKGTLLTQLGARIDSMYVSQWSDPDLGDSGDDFAGCDSTLSIGYVYNAGPTDASYAPYGLPPPSSGYDFFAGPIVNGVASDTAIFSLKKRGGKKNLGMRSFGYFAAGGQDSDPDLRSYNGTTQWWNLLRGYRPRVNTYFNPPAPPPIYPRTRYPLWGNVVAQTGWRDSSPGDRRILLCSGPFTMVLGDTQQVVVAVLAASGTDYRQSTALLKSYDATAQSVFDKLFVLPSAPASPKVNAIALNREVILDWSYDTNAVNKTEGQLNDQGYSFEGYTVYQLPTPGSSLSDAKALAYYDLVNLVKQISNPVLDPASGQFIMKPVRLGQDTGIRRYMIIGDDQFAGGPLINGRYYYFAVTAYNFNPGANLAFDPSLESSLQIIAVMPNSPPPGTRIPGVAGSEINLNHIRGVSTVSPKVIIIKPNELTGHLYKISFGNGNWSIKDSTSSVNLATSTDFGGIVSGDANDDYAFPLTDGFLTEVKETPMALVNSLTTWVSPNPVWIEGIRYNTDAAYAFDGGVTTAENLPNYLSNVATNWPGLSSYPMEMRFSTVTTQNAYRMRRAGGVGTQYVIQAVNPFVSVPFTVWDMSGTPRQMTVSWRDQNSSSTWDPVVDDDGLEVIFIYNRSYNPAGNQWLYQNAVGYVAADWSNVATTKDADIVYGVSLGIVPGHVINESIGTLAVVPDPTHLKSADVFTFTTPGVQNTAELLKEDANQINVFPNPYYGNSSIETSRYEHFVRFNHLPNSVFIRIFSLAGTLVRTISKNDQNQFLDWNLQNEIGLPVASGIYLARIQLPGTGQTKILKLAIIQERQYLNIY